MRKFTALLLAVLCAVGLSACGKADAENETENRESTETGTEEQNEESFMNPTAYKEGHYYLEDLDACIKRYGRTQYVNHMMTCDWSASGISMRVKSEGGSMTVGYNSSYPVYFVILIDGERVSREQVSGKGMMRFALKEGDHEVTILKDTEINISQKSCCYLTEIGFTGKFYEKPADKERYIEIIGDSIACGDGALGVFTPGVNYKLEEHAGTQSFSVVCAEELDADWSLITRGGIGVVRSRDEVGLPMPKIYPYISPYNDMAHEYGFERKPDLIVFELGANDSQEVCTEDGYYEAMCLFIEDILEKNGKDTPIVWTGKSEGHFGSAQKYHAEHPEVNFHEFRFLYGTSGAGSPSTATAGHPNAQEQYEYGVALANFIREEGLLQ